MQSRKVVIGAVAVVGLAVAWYLFRPERLFINQTVNEGFPAVSAGEPRGVAKPVALATGKFHAVAHDGKGTATIHQLPDGKRVLRLTEFETSNGPALRVYLGKAADANDDATVKSAGFLDLGELKGNKGDQNYDLPADADWAQYRSVTIWCQRFSVNFTTAPLMPPA